MQKKGRRSSHESRAVRLSERAGGLAQGCFRMVEARSSLRSPHQRGDGSPQANLTRVDHRSSRNCAPAAVAIIRCNSDRRDIKMALIIWFLALVAAGDVLAYLVGLFVEYQWGGYTSLVVFLAMYFITLWVAWRIAVWMTTPKLVPDGTGAGVA